jgi:hypothetical protein
VLLAAKIFEKNFLIDDLCHQVFPQLKQFLLMVFCQFRIMLVETFFTNFETVSPDENVVSGNLQRYFLLHWFV